MSDVLGVLHAHLGEDGRQQGICSNILVEQVHQPFDRRHPACPFEQAGWRLRWHDCRGGCGPYPFSPWCSVATAIEPSPTADATRLVLPLRTSPTASTPGMLVSSR